MAVPLALSAVEMSSRYTQEGGVLVALAAERLRGLQGPIDAVEAAANRLGLTAVTRVAALLITQSTLGHVGAWRATGAS